MSFSMKLPDAKKKTKQYGLILPDSKKVRLLCYQLCICSSLCSSVWLAA